MRSLATVGRWSSRRPWRAIALWIVFVAAALAVGVATGTKDLDNGAVGESARGYELLSAHQAWPPPSEYAYLRSETLRVHDARFEAATKDVAAQMERWLADVDVRTAPGGRSALVVGR